jgi:torulene dioxygenase
MFAFLCLIRIDYFSYGMSLIFNKNIAESIEKWDPKANSTFYVIDRKSGGIIAKYQVPISLKPQIIF